MSWISKYIARQPEAYPDDTELDHVMAEAVAASLAEDDGPEPMAVDQARKALGSTLRRLETSEARLAQDLTELTERLRQVRVTRAALTEAHATLERDQHHALADRVPQAPVLGLVQ